MVDLFASGFFVVVHAGQPGAGVHVVTLGGVVVAAAGWPSRPRRQRLVRWPGSGRAGAETLDVHVPVTTPAPADVLGCTTRMKSRPLAVASIELINVRRSFQPAVTVAG